MTGNNCLVFNALTNNSKALSELYLLFSIVKIFSPVAFATFDNKSAAS